MDRRIKYCRDTHIIGPSVLFLQEIFLETNNIINIYVHQSVMDSLKLAALRGVDVNELYRNVLVDVKY